MPDDTAPPREPDWEKATAEEEEEYVAKLAAHKKRMDERAEQEKPDFWRLDQVSHSRCRVCDSAQRARGHATARSARLADARTLDARVDEARGVGV